MDIRKVQQIQAEILRKNIALQKKEISLNHHSRFMKSTLDTLRKPCYRGSRRTLKKFLFKSNKF